MKREPSLHITKSDLIGVLERLGYEHANKVANQIFKVSKPWSIHTRTITVSNDRMEKKADKMLQSSRRDADLLASLIYARRQHLNHKGVTRIKPGSQAWPSVKEITGHALDFCNEFKIVNRRAGFIKYVDTALMKMAKFNLNRIMGLYGPICEAYAAIVEIEMDDDREMTTLLYNIYAGKIIENTGIHDSLEQIPEKYVWFVRARQQSKQLNVSPEVYMLAQFEALDFAKGIPHPTQMVGPQATERVTRYMYKHGHRITTNGTPHKESI